MLKESYLFLVGFFLLPQVGVTVILVVTKACFKQFFRVGDRKNHCHLKGNIELHTELFFPKLRHYYFHIYLWGSTLHQIIAVVSKVSPTVQYAAPCSFSGL